MPELPDIAAYISAIDQRIAGSTLERVRITTPFLLRSTAPPLIELEGRPVSCVRRIGKRIAIGLEGDDWLVLHLMIAGRLHWFPTGGKQPGRNILAAFDFSTGALSLTEAGSKRRASLHAVRSAHELDNFDPGGLDVFTATAESFRSALTRENHTVKRALTDPTILDGIGNAYSDEILHAARLSPLAQTHKLTEPEWERLYAATQSTLKLWIDRLTVEAAKAFPEKVTAFRPEMAAHGQYGKPCPVCSTPIQRIRYADKETNYCPTCQTGGKILADRGLSRLLGADWPKTLEELEILRRK